MTFRLPSIRFALALAAAGPVMTAAPAQEPTIKLGDSADSNAAKVVNRILLRPGATVPFYPFIANETATPWNVTAELRSADGQVLAKSAPIAVEANKRASVTFPTAAARSLTGRQVALVLLDAQNKEIAKTNLGMQSLVPSEYANAKAEIKGNRDTEYELRVEVGVPSPVTGGPVKARLDLSRVSGLALDSIKDATLVGEAPETGGTIVLVANLKFTGEPRPGIIGVTVDGYDRAFLFQTDFKGTTPQPVEQKSISIIAKRYAQPTEKFPVTIETSLVNDPDAYIDFRFIRSSAGETRPETRNGDRDRTVTLTIGPGLQFGSTVKDWTIYVNAVGVLGTREMIARLMAPKGEQPNPATDTERLATTAQVTFDETAPDLALKPAAEYPRGKPIEVLVNATDPESGIYRVLVGITDAFKETDREPVVGKIYPATPTGKVGEYVAKLPLQEAKGHVVVRARAINMAGLTKDVSAEFDVVDSSAGAKATTGKIKGTVVEGAPPRFQPTKPVYLINDKQTAVVDNTQTNDKGEFAFKDVAPGKYFVRSDKKEDRTTAQLPVTVEAGKTSEVELDLKRVRPVKK